MNDKKVMGICGKYCLFWKSFLVLVGVVVSSSTVVGSEMVDVSVEVVENDEDIKVEEGRNVRPTTEVEERDKADLAIRRANMFNRVLVSVDATKR